MRKIGWKSSIVLLMGLSLYFYVTFLLFWPYQPMVIHSVTPINPNKVVYAGEYLIYELDYTKEKVYPVTQVSRQLVDGFIIMLASRSHSSYPVGQHRKHIYAKVPDFTDAGEYYLRISMTYQVNYLRTITVTANSSMFTVKKKS